MEKKALVQLRLPSDLHQWLTSFASENDRSMNGQMVSILREVMQTQTRLKVGSEVVKFDGSPPQNLIPHEENHEKHCQS